MKRNLFGIMLLSGISILPKANAQTTYEEMEQLTVNEQITTVITASEPVRFVDISTDKVAGDQPIDNIIRLKPKESGHEDGEILAIVTIVTERYRTQYALIYTTRMKEAVTDKEILLQERNAINGHSCLLPIPMPLTLRKLRDLTIFTMQPESCRRRSRKRQICMVQKKRIIW